MATSQSLKRGFHRLTVFLVTALLIPAVTALEGSAGQSPTCVEEALNAYTQATLALSQRQDLMSLYSDLRRRRLEEKYCLRIARCMDDTGWPLWRSFRRACAKKPSNTTMQCRNSDRR